MERRVSRRRTASLKASSQGDQTLLNPQMDPSLWSGLPQENLLDIFDALPVKDYFRLGRVCKEWHDKASERRPLPDEEQVRVREPFFLLVRRSREECSPLGTLALHAATAKWMWQPASAWQSSYNWPYGWYGIGNLLESFEVEGVLFQMPQTTTVPGFLNYMGLFDVHRHHANQKLYRPGVMYTTYIPHVDPAPESVLGMMVDEDSRAYTLILGSPVMDTLVLDSRTNKWEPKPSRLARARPSSASAARKSCVQLQGKMYLWMDSDEIHVYSPSSNEWSSLPVPPRDELDDDQIRGLGHWGDELYAVAKNKQGTLSVWKFDGDWSEYAEIPGWLFAHLMLFGAVLPIMVSHCKGYFLIHVLAQPNTAPQPKATMRWDEFMEQQKRLRPVLKLDRRFILFNIANKKWEMVDMPYTKMWKGS